MKLLTISIIYLITTMAWLLLLQLLMLKGMPLYEFGHTPASQVGALKLISLMFTPGIIPVLIYVLRNK